jgi:hypothetical protein
MTGRRTTIIAAASLAALLLTGAGCGKVADKVTEKATEKAIDHTTGGSVDLKDGGVTYKDKDGNSIDMSEGGGTYKDKNGGEANYGSTAKLPDGWPSEVKLPSGMKLSVSQTQKSADGDEMVVIGTVTKGTVQSLRADMKAMLTDAGFTIDDDSLTTSGGGAIAALSASKGKKKATISIVDSGSGDTKNVSITVTPNS